MTPPEKDRLYGLLPAVYRRRDADHGEVLRTLTGILQEPFDLLEKDIAGLYDDWFIETCQEWVVPYIAGLLGARLIHTIESTGAYSQRAIVANTLSYRRRKGTLLMLEDLAADVTGWGAHAVEFFQLLGWTQNLNHQRHEPAPNPNPRNPGRLNPDSVDRVGSVNLRSLDVVDNIGRPFDRVSHTVDIRLPAQTQGWYNIRNLGVFLWRLHSYPATGVRPQASASCADGFHFSPLGNPMPLFNNPQRKQGNTGLRREVHVPGPIRPLDFHQYPQAYYGHDTDLSLAVYRGPAAVPGQCYDPESILCKDLVDWSPPPAGKVALDVDLGRLAFAPGETPLEGVTVSYRYGFSADMGGGPYDRAASMAQATADDWVVVVSRQAPDPLTDPWRPTVAAAIADWDPVRHPRAVILIADNGTYAETLNLSLADRQHLIVQAGNRKRPLLRLQDEMGDRGSLTVTGGNGAAATLSLNGLLIEGGLTVAAASLGCLEITDCTLVPGLALDEAGLPVAADAASVTVDGDNDDLHIAIGSSIVGPLRLPRTMGGLEVSDSIVDAPGDSPVAICQPGETGAPGPASVLERTTVRGRVDIETLELATAVIFTHAVRVRRCQEGCLRYSYVDDRRSDTPRRFRCQPELSLETRKKQLQAESLPAAEESLVRKRVRPDFTSRQYGRPGYCQLDRSTPAEITAGARNGAEMGAFNGLMQPQRRANLRIRLKEVLPCGLETGLVTVT